MTIDRASETWREVSIYCLEQIEKARDLLENTDSGHITRGRIKAYREILALVAEAEPPKMLDPAGYDLQGADLGG